MTDVPKLKNKSLLLVKAQNTLRVGEKTSGLEADIIALVYHRFADPNKHRTDIELVKYILNCIEEAWKDDVNKDSAENYNSRVDLVISIFVKLFPDAAGKSEDIKDMIVFLENNALVQSVGCWRKTKKSLCAIFSGKSSA